MADYISREAAIEKITALINESGKYTAYESGADDACYVVEHEIPAADVRPVVHGKWEIMSNPRFRRCSVCHDKVLMNMKNLPNFCDVCGADMREVETNG